MPALKMQARGRHGMRLSTWDDGKVLTSLEVFSLKETSHASSFPGCTGARVCCAQGSASASRHGCVMW